MIFFRLLDAGRLLPESGFNNGRLGTCITVFTDSFPDLENDKPDLAIIGVLEDRNADGNSGCALGPDYIREILYQLFEGSYKTKIIDLGNIRRGETVVDTFIALKTVVAELIKKDILPVIIGGSQDLTYAQYLAYEVLGQKVDLVVVDAKLDMDDDHFPGTIETTSAAYLNKIFMHEPDMLFNFSNLGYQTYFVNQERLQMMEKLFFDAHRLGSLSGKIQLTEPVIRNASMISFDVGAVRSSDAQANF